MCLPYKYTGFYTPVLATLHLPLIPLALPDTSRILFTSDTCFLIYYSSRRTTPPLSYSIPLYNTCTSTSSWLHSERHFHIFALVCLCAPIPVQYGLSGPEHQMVWWLRHYLGRLAKGCALVSLTYEITPSNARTKK